MSWKYTDEYYREYTRTTWNEAAENWLNWMGLLKPVGEHLIRRLHVRRGLRVLDLGTGTGEPALTLSAMVGPSGHVTGVDLSEKMIQLSSEIASKRGMTNTTFSVMDAEKLTFAANAFDLVVSRFGFQIFTNPDVAAGQAYRVLKPGGEIGVTVWSTGDKVPALHALVGPMLEHAEPDETGYLPTPYEMGGNGELVKFLRKVGFREAREERVTEKFRFKDEEEYFSIVLNSTPFGHSLSEEDPDVQKKVLRQARSNLQAWKTSSGITLPAEIVIVTAKK